jgi:Saxitoxin biosynthesis operon protein SxtJ
MDHEPILATPLPSNRSVGLVFAIFFLLLAMFPLVRGGAVHTWAFVVSGSFGLISLAMPRLLTPLTRYWMGLANILHNIVSPVVLGVLFFLVVTPVGCLMRLSGKDPLRLKLEPTAHTYWQERLPAGPAPESLLNQF